MEKIAELFKILIEKHLIPALISVVGAIIALLLVPGDYWMITKLGNTLFVILAFCCNFLVVQIVITIGKQIKALNIKISENRYYNKQRLQSNQVAIQTINDFVDRLSPDDKKLLLAFVINDNKILVAIEAYRSFEIESLLENTNVMNRSRFVGDIEHIDENIYWVEPSLKEIYSQGMRPFQGLWQYKIKDSLFHDLKLLYKQQGKLGNF